MSGPVDIFSFGPGDGKITITKAEKNVIDARKSVVPVSRTGRRILQTYVFIRRRRSYRANLRTKPRKEKITNN